MLKSLFHFGIVVALCAAAFAQSTFRWEHGHTYGSDSYRYKSIGFQNIVVQVADVPPLRYGARQFAAFRIIVLNEDKKRRVELESDRILCSCGRRKSAFSRAFQEGHPFEPPNVREQHYFSVDQLRRDRAVRWNPWSRDTRLVTIRLGNVTFHYLF